MAQVLSSVSVGKGRTITETSDWSGSHNSMVVGFLRYLLSVIDRRSSLQDWYAGTVNGKTTKAADVRPGDIFPNFIAKTATGPFDFWEWAENSWSYVMQLPDTPTECFEELLFYALASTQLRAQNIKVLGINTMPVLELSEIMQDVSAIAGQQLNVTLVSDEFGRLTEMLSLQTYESGATAPVHRSFLIGPELRLRVCEMSSFPIFANAFEMIELVKRMRWCVSGPGSESQIRQNFMKTVTA